jgi:S-adenosylmethionine synthetase
MEFLVAPLAQAPDEGPAEAAERKGLGHPDTICDALAEELSRALLRHYLERFGRPLHYNVDKVLLAAGRARAAFGGGEVLAPIEIFLAGRATLEHGGVRVPVEEIAVEACRGWLARHLHALDAQRDVRLHCLVRPGSAELVDLFVRGAPANDTSCGVGFAPLTPLERLVLGVERALNAPDARARHPECGEDVKVMGVRLGRRVEVTLACALIGRRLAGPAAYAEAKRALAARAREAAAAAWAGQPGPAAARAGQPGTAAARAGQPGTAEARAAQPGTAGGGARLDPADLDLRVNAADDEAKGRIYLTVTGTSAEAGDDGQVGRGNRVNGLITFHRPMSLEAAAGKNPVSHVGKLYNVTAGRAARDLLALPDVAAAECRLVSRIGAPVTDPAVAEVRLRTRGRPAAELRGAAEEIVRARLRGAGELWREFLAGGVEVF